MVGSHLETLKAVLLDGELLWLDPSEAPSWFLNGHIGYQRLNVRTSKLAAAHALSLFAKSKREEAWKWLKTVSQSMESA